MALVLSPTVGQLAGLTQGVRVPGDKKRVVLLVTLDSAYPTGGTVITAAQCGLTVLDTVNVWGGLSQAGTRLVQWDQTNSKLKCYTAINTEVANTTNLSADSVVVEAIGS